MNPPVKEPTRVLESLPPEWQRFAADTWRACSLRAGYKVSLHNGPSHADPLRRVVLLERTEFTLIGENQHEQLTTTLRGLIGREAGKLRHSLPPLAGGLTGAVYCALEELRAERVMGQEIPELKSAMREQRRASLLRRDALGQIPPQGSPMRGLWRLELDTEEQGADAAHRVPFTPQDPELWTRLENLALEALQADWSEDVWELSEIIAAQLEEHGFAGEGTAAPPGAPQLESAGRPRNTPGRDLKTAQANSSQPSTRSAMSTTPESTKDSPQPGQKGDSSAEDSSQQESQDSPQPGQNDTDLNLQENQNSPQPGQKGDSSAGNSDGPGNQDSTPGTSQDSPQPGQMGNSSTENSSEQGTQNPTDDAKAGVDSSEQGTQDSPQPGQKGDSSTSDSSNPDSSSPDSERQESSESDSSTRDDSSPPHSGDQESSEPNSNESSDPSQDSNDEEPDSNVGETQPGSAEGSQNTESSNLNAFDDSAGEDSSQAASETGAGTTESLSKPSDQPGPSGVGQQGAAPQSDEESDFELPDTELEVPLEEPEELEDSEVDLHDSSLESSPLELQEWEPQESPAAPAPRPIEEALTRLGAEIAGALRPRLRSSRVRYTASRGDLEGLRFERGFERLYRNRSRPGRRGGLNLCLLIDASGSMSGAKLLEVKSTCALLMVGAHYADAPVRAVAFNSEASTLCGPQDSLERGLSRVRALSATGGTTLGPALDLMVPTLKADFCEDAPATLMVFLTDGAVSDPSQAQATLKAAQNAHRALGGQLSTLALLASPKPGDLQSWKGIASRVTVLEGGFSGAATQVLAALEHIRDALERGE